MTHERLLMDSFTSHENLTPDPDQALAAIMTRVEQKGSSTGRRLAVVATVVAIAATGAGIIAIDRHNTSGNERPAAASHAPLSVASSHRTALKTPIAPVSIDLKVGWLPAGAEVGDWMKFPDGGDYISYDISGLANQKSGVFLAHDAASSDLPFKAGPDEHGTATTIAGRPALEHVSQASYEVYVKLADGSYGHVIVYGLGGSEAAQAAIGRHVAGTADFGASTSFTPAFGLDATAASNLHLIDGGGSGAKQWVTYTFGADGAAYAAVDSPDALDVPRVVDVNGQPSYTPGRPVQGHQTRVSSNGSLQILDVIGGYPIVLGGQPLDELYQLAHSLILP